MPGQLSGRLRDTHGKKLIQQGRQAEGIDDIGGVGQFVQPPPPMSGMVATLEGFHAGRVDVVSADTVEEEVITEQAARPAKICVAAGVGDRVAQCVRVDDEADLLAEFTRRGFLEQLTVVHAAARGHPTMPLLGVRGVKEEFEKKHVVTAI